MSIEDGNLTGVSILIDWSPDLCSKRCVVERGGVSKGPAPSGEAQGPTLNWKVRTGGISLMLSCLTASCSHSSVRQLEPLLRPDRRGRPYEGRDVT